MEWDGDGWTGGRERGRVRGRRRRRGGKEEEGGKELRLGAVRGMAGLEEGREGALGEAMGATGE